MLPITTSKVTSDHEEIRRWAESRGAKPAAVIGGESDGAAGIIHLNFPGQSSAGPLVEIGWDEWFSKLDKHKLALLYQEHTAGGENSSFNQIISRETAEEAHNALGGKGRSAAHKGAEKSAKKTSSPNSHDESGSERREEKGRQRTIRKTGKPASARGRASGNAGPRSRVGDKRATSSRGARASTMDVVKN